MISRALRDRVLTLAAAEPSPTHAEVRRTTLLVLAGAAAVALAAFVFAGGIRPTGRPHELMLATAAMAVLVAGGASWLAVSRGRSSSGRRRDVLVALLLVVPLLLVAAKLSLSAAWPGMSHAWPDRPGFRCLRLFLIVGAAPLTAYLWVFRLRDVPRPALQGATLGLAAGACAWVLVDLWCPVAHPAHLLLGHILPMALLVGAGVTLHLLRR